MSAVPKFPNRIFASYYNPNIILQIKNVSNYMVDGDQEFEIYLLANKPVKWEITSEEDSHLFSLDTNKLFLSRKNSNNPLDANNDNEYIVGVRATDNEGNSSTKIISVTINP